MARVIEFYVPNRFQRPLRRIPQMHSGRSRIAVAVTAFTQLVSTVRDVLALACPGHGARMWSNSPDIRKRTQ